MRKTKKRVRFDCQEEDKTDTKKTKNEIPTNIVFLQFFCPVNNIDTSNTDPFYLDQQVNRMIAKILFLLHDELHTKISNMYSICIGRKAYEFSYKHKVLYDSIFTDSFADEKEEYSRLRWEIQTLISILEKNNTELKIYIDKFINDEISEDHLNWIYHSMILESRYLKYLKSILPDVELHQPTKEMVNQENTSFQIPLKIGWEKPQRFEPDMIEIDVNNLIVRTLYTISGRLPVQFKTIFLQKINEYIL